MTQSFTSLDSLLLTIVLATLAVGLPVLVVLAVRFLLDRSLNLGRSKELEKLIWQMHRIASAMEHQMNLSFPAVQPGTEEPRDLAYLQQLAHPAVTTPAVATPVAVAAAPAAPRPAVQQPAAPQPAMQQPVPQAAAQQPAPPPPAPEDDSLPPLQIRQPNAEARRAGVNSMFDL
jgi:hypothetical protein